MKKEDYQKKAWNFVTILPHVSEHYSEIKFRNETKERLYFNVKVALEIHGYDYDLIVFVDKKNLDVEFCSKNNVIVTEETLKFLKERWYESLDTDDD